MKYVISLHFPRIFCSDRGVGSKIFTIISSAESSKYFQEFLDIVK